jgi:hypothetical protein
MLTMKFFVPALAMLAIVAASGAGGAARELAGEAEIHCVVSTYALTSECLFDPGTDGRVEPVRREYEPNLTVREVGAVTFTVEWEASSSS